MTHYASPAFYQCLYLHYADRLTDPGLPEFMRNFMIERMQELAIQFAESFRPIHQQFFSKLLNLSKMQTPQMTPVQTDALLHMAKIIERKIQDNRICFIHSNSERIALKDQNQVVIAWVKIS